VTTFSKLADMIQQSAVPDWVREAVVTRRDEILKSLREKGFFNLAGPNGVVVEIRVSKDAIAA
jgi:hypothetical protein